MSDRNCRYFFAVVLLFCATFAHSQGLRWDLGAPGSAGAVTTSGTGGLPTLLALPGVSLAWCNYPANAVPCTNYATTYTNFSLGTACPNNAQIVLQGSSSCQATSDNFGGMGVYAATNTACGGLTCYAYTLTYAGISFGPYLWIQGGGSGGGGSGGNYGVDATKFSGADPCQQIQAAIYSLPSTGGIVNATNFTSISACSVNPFQALSQSNPTVLTGAPIAGLLLLPLNAFPSDVPWVIPSKWRVLGVGGYGTNRSTIEPSANFLANRIVQSASGTGSTGCSGTRSTQTLTISGITFTNTANLVGMYIQCSANNSSTAVPTVQNAQIGGIITNVSGTGPYTITIGGNGAVAGTISNTGWTINPIIGAWQPQQTFGSLIEQVTFTCQSPSTTYVAGCIGFADFTANESGRMTDDSIIGADYVGLLVMSAQSQNGGLFQNLTINWANNPNSGSQSIGIEVGGTGFNAFGGGATGLCSTSNACEGVPNRGFFGLTLLGGTANTGGIGVDLNAGNTDVVHSHCESLQTCINIGGSAAVQGAWIESVTGCTSSSCSITSVADIQSAYQSGSAPAPTQNITLKNLQRGYSTTWNVRDYIDLTGVNQSTLGTYVLGASGNSSRMVFTDAQQMECITTGGVQDTNGAHCAPASQIQITSKVDGIWFADSFNNNGTSDVCQQINNALQYTAQVAGLTDGVLMDATGFNRNSGYPCGSNPFAGTVGTTIPAGGVLRLGLGKFFLTSQWTVPANWILQGSGGNGLGTAGAAGSLLSPNINNTSNANYANDSTAGTVSTTAGSYTVTGSGSSWTSALVGHYLMACGTLPCTNQSTMAGGIVNAVNSSTSITLDVPAQSSLSGANYTVTAPLVQNAGIIRDLGIDGNSYGTGSANGNGGFVGIYQDAGAGGDSYLDNVSIAHVNAIGIDAAGLNNLPLGRVQVAASGLASSVFTCITAPQGIGVNSLICETGTTPTPTLSYGVMASGTGFKLDNLLFQNVAIGVELAVNPNFSTNNVTVSNAQSGSSTAAVGTLIDLGGVSSGSNGPNFQADLLGLQCPSGCTNAVVDHLNSYTLTDAILGWYMVSRTNGNGNRTVMTDSLTLPAVNAANGLQTSGTGALISFGTSNDTGLSRISAGVFGIGNGTQGDTTASMEGAGYISVGTKFTTSGGCGETSGTTTGGATAGKFQTSGTTSCSTVITLPTAPHGWSCTAIDLTTSADAVNPHQTATTTTSATITSGTIVGSDVIQFSCVGY